MKVTCPFGNPSTKHSCNPDPNGEYCPVETHYCYGLSVGPTSDKQVCCPKECPFNTVSVKGKCLPQAGLNEACAVSEQCTDTSAECISGKHCVRTVKVSDFMMRIRAIRSCDYIMSFISFLFLGFCKCSNGSKEAGGAVYKYCTRECKESETLYNTKCYSQLSLGDSCEGQDWRCPPNAYCNSKKVCACQCGMFTLSKDVCAPAPSCPQPVFIMPMFAGDAKVNYEVKTYSTIHQQEKLTV